MKITITGASGLIGSQLMTFLRGQGHTVTAWKWRMNSEDINKIIAHAEQENVEGGAVVHLAGENIADRWTADKMLRIRESRVIGTKLLSQALAKLARRPKVLVCASAVGYYGNRGNEMLDERSSKGSGFLADLCQQWEAATAPAREAGIRVVNLRIGMVLSNKGGALSKMLLPFQLGAGGEIGDGRQYMSWIDIDDLVAAIDYTITNESLQGPVNAVAPYPVTNREFTATLGKVLHRPAVIPVPAFALRLLFGQMADEVLLSGQKVMPVQLQSSGYQFRYPDIESSLKHVLQR